MIKRLAVGGATALALAGMSATGAVASTAGAQPGVASHVMHVDIHGVEATITLRGGWRLGKSEPSARLRRIHAASTGQSFNWGGYADSGHSVAFRFAAADFAAPNADCTSSLVENGQSVVADLIGLGGLASNNVEQVGFEQDCEPSVTPALSFAAMYVIGGNATFVTGAAPGDELAASVYYNSGNGEYSLDVNDLTEPGGFLVTTTCPNTCDLNSAEVLSEDVGFDPSDPSSSFALADYGASWFNAAAVTSRNGTRGNLGSNKLWSPVNLTTVDTNGSTIQSAGSLQSGNSSFEETWKAAS